MIHDVHLLVLSSSHHSDSSGFVPIPLFWTSRARGNLGNGAGVTVASWLPQAFTSVEASPKITGLPLHPSCQGATWRATAHSWNLQAPGLGKKQMEDAQIVDVDLELPWSSVALRYLSGMQPLTAFA